MSHPHIFIPHLSSTGEDVVTPRTEVKMADASPLPPSAENWSQTIPDRSSAMAVQFRAFDTLGVRLHLIQPPHPQER